MPDETTTENGKTFARWLSDKLSTNLVGISRSTFARSCGFDEANLYHFTSGARLPNAEKLENILKSFGNNIVSEEERAQVRQLVQHEREQRQKNRKTSGRPKSSQALIRLFPSVSGEVISAITAALAKRGEPSDRETIHRQLQNACYNGGINAYLESLGLPPLKNEF